MVSQGPPFDEADTKPMPVVRLAPLPSIKPMGLAEKLQVFGRFNFTPSPVPGNPEHITIAGSWEAQNIVRVQVPQLGNRPVTMHRLVVAQFLKLWAAWEVAGLRDRIITFDGGFNPRYKRKRAFGGVENLSNHSWGSAFDVNALLLPLGRPCPTVGTHGCTSELVPLAHEYGFDWGGDFHAPWQDAMHFQVYRVLA